MNYGLSQTLNLRVIDSGAANGFYNMALDEALFLICGKQALSSSLFPTLRFYTFSPPTITIGRFQPAVGILNLVAEGNEVKNLKEIPVVRRITGGRAVFHDRDLTYSLIGHSNHPFFGGNSFDGYKRMSLIFRDALLLLGVEAQLVRIKHSEYQKNPACFSSIARYELQVNGKKILGSAQRRKDGVVLQQGSLIINSTWNQIGLNQILGREFKINEIIDAIKKTLKNLGINITNGTLIPEEEELAYKLIPKYQQL